MVSALATLVIICSLFSWCCKKKETELNTLTKGVTGVTHSLPQQAYCDVEKGRYSKNSCAQDGNMAILMGFYATVDAAAACGGGQDCGVGGGV